MPSDVGARKAEGHLMAGRAVGQSPRRGAAATASIGRALGRAANEARGGRRIPNLSLVGDSEEQRLFTRVAPIVNGLVWSMLGPDSEREDIAHEAFIRIFRAHASLRQAESIDAWAARVTVNTVKNELRRRRLRRWVSFDFWNDDPPLRTHVDDVQGRELLKAAFRVLERLPTNERVALSLRFFHDVGIEEIARLSGCSLRTAKRRLTAARTQFERLARRDPLLAGWLGSQVTEDDHE
jgi:RNA polymerase sigma-70 factor (ECF subfamily)